MNCPSKQQGVGEVEGGGEKKNNIFFSFPKTRKEGERNLTNLPSIWELEDEIGAGGMQ